MSTTKDDIREWFERGKAEGATHMLVICDTFDWDDYPVYVMPGENPREKAGESQYGPSNMQKLMEVYSLSRPMDEQLSERRAFHWD